MTRPTDQPPELNALVPVLLVAVAAVAAIVLVVGGALAGRDPGQMAMYGLALLAVAVVAALVIAQAQRRAARRRRAEWLATTEWQAGILSKQEEWRQKHPTNPPAES
jgi:membrane protein YdbS with pleckstrin-like domain